MGAGRSTYLVGVEHRLEEQGFEPLDQAGPAHVYRRRRFELTKFGMFETFLVVHHATEGDGAELERLTEAAQKLSLENKVPLVRGLGSGVLAYPVLVAEAVSGELRHFVVEFRLSRAWAAFTFPVVVDLASGEALMNDRTPVWGFAYYRGFRKEAKRLLAPPPPGGAAESVSRWRATSPEDRRRVRGQVRRVGLAQLGLLVGLVALVVLPWAAFLGPPVAALVSALLVVVGYLVAASGFLWARRVEKSRFM